MKEFEEINNCINKKLISLLFRIVPEYALIFKQNNVEEDLHEDDIYLFMSDFATSLGKEMIINNSSSSYVSNSFTYINKLGESNNLEIINIVKVGILEILYTTNNLDRDCVNNLLSEKLRIYFNDFSNYYRS